MLFVRCDENNQNLVCSGFFFSGKTWTYQAQNASKVTTKKKTNSLGREMFFEFGIIILKK